jgi:hypothetical protein
MMILTSVHNDQRSTYSRSKATCAIATSASVVRPRSDERHVAFDDIDHWAKFVEAGEAQDATDQRHARIDFLGAVMAIVAIVGS